MIFLLRPPKMPSCPTHKPTFIPGHGSPYFNKRTGLEDLDAGGLHHETATLGKRPQEGNTMDEAKSQKSIAEAPKNNHHCTFLVSKSWLHEALGEASCQEALIYKPVKTYR